MKIKGDPDNGAIKFDTAYEGAFTLTVSEDNYNSGRHEASVLLNESDLLRVIAKLQRRLVQVKATQG